MNRIITRLEEFCSLTAFLETWRAQELCECTDPYLILSNEWGLSCPSDIEAKIETDIKWMQACPKVIYKALPKLEDKWPDQCGAIRIMLAGI